MHIFCPNPDILSLPEYSHGDDAIHYDAIDFSANVNSLGPPAEIVEFIKTLDPVQLRHYPDTGCTRLKEQLSCTHSVPVENIIVGNGSLEVLRLFCQCFLKKGDEVLIPVPTFSEYERMVKLHGGTCTFVEMKNLLIDPHEIIEKIGDLTKVIFLCNPNNPTGFYSEDIMSVVDEAEKRDAFVFLDEAFIDFSCRKSLVQESTPNLFVLKSATKLYAIPALRCGYGFSSKDVIAYMEKVATPWNVNYIAQEAVRRALCNESFIEDTRRFLEREKRYLFSELSKIPYLDPYPSDTNFFLLKTKIQSHRLKKLLLERGVLIRDCSNFRGLDSSYVRLCVKPHEPNEMLVQELRRLHEEPK
ncbi:MAG: histidinol-phosphate aminotransferase family protein [Theionarchaea archaeon]|nr:histidinol-phosphate aminotransferase family protein [Theionarchaea archaeon]